MVDYYAKRAEHYECRYFPERRGDLKNLRSICKKLLSGHDVLELACGTGIWTQYIASLANSVLAIDINLEMLEIAQRKLYPRKNVSFMQMDAYNLSDITSKYTAGFSGWWFSHVPKDRILGFLQNFHQQLVSNALVVLMDDTLAVGDSISNTDSSGNTYTVRHLKDNSQYEICKNFYTETELREIVQPVAVNIKFSQFIYHWLLSYNARQIHSSVTE